MRRSRRTALVGWAAVCAVGTAMALPTATAAPASDAPASRAAGAGGSDLRDIGPLVRGKQMSLDSKSMKVAKERIARQRYGARKANGDFEVGDQVPMLALNDVTDRLYVKTYTLRGIGDHIQVWVADDRAFPTGDCRNTLNLTDVTNAQVDNFVHEFDTNIYPKESATFSVPPALNGADAPLAGLLGLPADTYKVSADQADDIVTLVDNVRDANFFAPTTPDGQTYIAGFFSGQFNGLLNHNVMTIDAFDWLHRTGANPPNDTTDPAYQACSAALGGSRPLGTPYPHRYEGVFAHEYQHLLESYQDPDEVNWVNEGLSDWAQTLVGYVDPSISPTKPTADSHLSCFAGYQDPRFGGPENSLTLWGDQGGPEILCDYGAAYSMMEYLQSHYGTDFMTTLHRYNRNGLKGLDAVLKKFGSTKSATDTVHDWAAAMALDARVDRSGSVVGAPKQDVTAKTLSARINWANPQAYDSPGAPPNGSDYVRLRSDQGRPYSADRLQYLSFDGTETLAPDPIEWTVDSTPPDATTADTTCGASEDGTGAAALYSGCGDELDRSAVRSVTVPASGGQLSFDALWDTEEAWDFGYVQASPDGGKTWVSLPTEDTTSDHDPQAAANVVANLPGLTGDSGTWKTEHADLTPWAGKTILIGFRYITDTATAEAGFWVRNIDAAGTALPSDSLDGWQSRTQAYPTPVAGYTVQLVGYDSAGRSHIARLKLDGKFRGYLDQKALQAAVGKGSTVVAAIVMQDDPTETVTKYARYSLVVNGRIQPGG